MGGMGVKAGGLASACAFALVVSMAAFGNSPASGQSTERAAETPRSSAELIGAPADRLPDVLPDAPPESGVIGNEPPGSEMVRSVPGFGRIAAKSRVGVRTYRYSTLPGNASTLDVYTPRAFVGRQGRNVRTVILVHGGAWQAGSPESLEMQAVDLARKLKVVVVSVSYRLATEAPWPAQRDDVNAALDFVRSHATELNVDDERMVILGSSAGGQIAASVATEGAGSERFRGLVTLSGLVSPLYMAQQNPGYSNAVIPDLLLRCLPAECPDLYRSATAAAALDPKDPPSLLFHSEDERSWDETQARQFASASQAVGVPSRLVVLPGRAHGIDTWSTVWPTLRSWLRQTLGKTDRVA